MTRASIVAALVGLAVAAAGVTVASDGADIRLAAIDGGHVAPLAGDPDVRATVALFVRTDCPISNRYVPEVQRIHDAYAGRGVSFWLVYPDPDARDDAIREHIEEFGYPMSALKDPRHRLVDHVGATITPEVALFDASGKLAYLGRIDDRYVDFGKARPEPTRRDLSLAIDAVLAGRPVEVDRAPAVGCFIGDLRGGSEGDHAPEADVEKPKAPAPPEKPICRRETECLEKAAEFTGGEGLRYLKFACHGYLRSAKACDKLGWALFTGNWGDAAVYADLDEAMSTLQRACRRGHRIACVRLEGIPINFDLDLKRAEMSEKNRLLYEERKKASVAAGGPPPPPPPGLDDSGE